LLAEVAGAGVEASFFSLEPVDRVAV
jgi:hypothetical protein